MLIILKTIRVKRYCYFSMKVLDEIETSARFSQLPIERLQSLVVLLKKMLGADRRIVDYAQEAKIRTGPLLDTTSHSRGVNKKLKYITYNKAGGQQKKKSPIFRLSVDLVKSPEKSVCIELRIRNPMSGCGFGSGATGKKYEFFLAAIVWI